MNRVQKKCLWGSTAAHGLLVLLTVAGSGFLAARRPPQSTQLLVMVPDRLVEEALAGGGGDPQGSQEAAAPRVAPPAPAPEPPPVQPPQPTPEPVVKQPVVQPPEPQREVPTPTPVQEKTPTEPEPKESRKPVKPVKPAPQQAKAVDSSPPKRPAAKKQPIALDPSALKPTVRSTSKDASKEASEKAALALAQTRARQKEDARRQLIAGVANSLQGRLSSGGVSAMPFGPGGESYANYGLFVLSLFDSAWRAPEEVSDDSATVKAKVVIARDGRVISATIVGRSGVSAVDKSVQAALDRVNSIGKPFPDGAKEEQRIFYINFNLKAKRALG